MATKNSDKTTSTKSKEILETVTPVPKPLSKIKEPTLFKLGADAEKIVEAFKAYLEQNNKAKATIRSYIYDVKSFLEFCETVENLVFTGQFTENYFKNYIKSQADTNRAIQTLNKRINSIASFNKYLVETNLMDTCIVDLKTDKITSVKTNTDSTTINSIFPQELDKIM